MNKDQQKPGKNPFRVKKPHSRPPKPTASDKVDDPHIQEKSVTTPSQPEVTNENVKGPAFIHPILYSDAASEVGNFRSNHNFTYGVAYAPGNMETYITSKFEYIREKHEQHTGKPTGYTLGIGFHFYEKSSGRLAFHVAPIWYQEVGNDWLIYDSMYEDHKDYFITGLRNPENSNDPKDDFFVFDEGALWP